MKIHDGMSNDPIQGQGQGYRAAKFAKMADVEVYLLRQYVCNQKTNGEYDTVYPKTIYVDFNWTDF